MMEKHQHTILKILVSIYHPKDEIDHEFYKEAKFFHKKMLIDPKK